MDYKDDGIRAISAITNAANRKAVGLISVKGLQATFNLYGKQLINSISNAMPNTIAKLTTSNLIKLGVTDIITVAIAPFIKKWM